MPAGIVAIHARVLHPALNPVGLVLAALSFAVFVVVVALVVRRLVKRAAPPSAPV